MGCSVTSQAAVSCADCWHGALSDFFLMLEKGTGTQNMYLHVYFRQNFLCNVRVYKYEINERLKQFMSGQFHRLHNCI